MVVGIEGKWVVVTVQVRGSRRDEDGQHWSCMGWT